MLHATRLTRGAIAVIIAAAMSASCTPDEAPVADTERPRVPSTPATQSAVAPSTQGLTCIKGGSTREEVRAAMGEPDSIAFGDWLYGRSSVTFGYGVVLDYSNAGGNLVLCP